jgi:hypothetical protein
MRQELDAFPSPDLLFFNSLGRFSSGSQNALKVVMNLNAITINNSLESILDSVFQNYSSTNSSTGNAAGSTGSSSQTNSDNGHLSPFAQLISFLQQLQQSNPAEYQSVTQQIATNLQSAAQTDQEDGNTAGATQLNQLSADFTDASTTGQLPNLQDLAQALGSNTDSPKITISLSQLEQLLASLQPSSTQNETSAQSQDPISIILNTLSGAGYNINNAYGSTN